MVVKVRAELAPDGTVTAVKVLNDEPDNPAFRQAAESAMRAVMISSPLRLPPGKAYDSITFDFRPGQIIE